MFFYSVEPVSVFSPDSCPLHSHLFFHLLSLCSLPTTISSDLLGKPSPGGEEAHELQSSMINAPANYLLSFVIFKLFLKL